jgi:ubiquinone/menaquinone biosynthesis C-methylase UbiE
MSANPDKYDILKKDTKRVDQRVNIITELLKLASINSLEKDVKKIKTYLDLGCGDASITAGVSEELKIETTYCADVVLSNESKYNNMTYLQINENDVKLEIEEKSVDLITCLVSMHHFRKLSDIIKEIDRISKVGTYLIIREHDANSLLQPFLDFIHLIYLIQKDMKLNDFYSCYYKRTDLKKCLENHGWKYLNSVDFPTNFENPQKLYSSIFIFEGIKNTWITPLQQTTEYRIDNAKLMRHIANLKDKKDYIKYLKKSEISEIDAIRLLNILNLDSFAEYLKKLKK